MSNIARGFFEIGIYHPKTSENVGTLWRSAWQLGAAGIFTVGRRYKAQASDTPKTTRHLPLRHYDSFEDLYAGLPYGAMLIGIEMGGDPIGKFCHPTRAIYLLGAEDHGLTPDILSRCHKRVSLQALRLESYNVAVAGSIVMYDRQYGGRHE